MHLIACSYSPTELLPVTKCLLLNQFTLPIIDIENPAIMCLIACTLMHMHPDNSSILKCSTIIQCRERTEEDNSLWGWCANPKKSKRVDRYPPTDMSISTDDATFERHLSALNKELEKPRPNKEVILELMKNTFSHCRESILDNALVADILKKYPALRKPDVVRFLIS